MGRKKKGRVKKAPSVAALILASVVGAWSADCIVDGAPLHFTAPAPAGRDATIELKWDNGTVRWNICWYSGSDTWVGNDFDLSTISSYKAILKYKFYTRVDWPNGRWDGVRIGFFAFSGGVPGARLWPTSGSGYFFKPNSTAPRHVWVACDINWTCPTSKFLAGQEQFYNYPNADVFALDDNPVFMRHSWQYLRGAWSLFDQPNLAPYRNAMLRIFVDDETVNVSPTSLGRVRALYY